MKNPYIFLENDYYDFLDILGLKEDYTEAELFQAYSIIENKTKTHLVGFKILKDPYYSKVYYNLKSIKKLYDAGFFIDEIPFDFYEKQSLIFDLNHLTTPFHKILNNLNVRSDKENIVLLTTGGFSPFHNGHLQMMEAAYKHLTNLDFNVVGGYIAPSHDKYVSNKYEGKAALNIEKRIDIINKTLQNHKWLDIDPWEGLYNKYEVNYTETIYRLENYLNKHLNVNIKVCLVYGGDNIGFNDTFINKGMGVCIKRHTYKNDFENFNNKNVFIVENNLGYNISSTEIRKQFKKQNLINDISYGIRNDGYNSVRNLNVSNDFVNSYFNKFKSIVKNHLVKDFNVEIEEISFSKQLLEANKIIKESKFKSISLDSYIKGDFNLELSRQFNISDSQIKGNKLINRPYTENLQEQISKIHYGEYLLIEDYIVSGNTLKLVKELLGTNVKFKEYCILSSFNNKDFFDIIDFRDFLIGSKEGGLVVNFKNKDIRVPYFLPYVSPHYRASIPLSSQLQFSYDCWNFNMKFYNEINPNLKLKDLSEDFQFLMKNIGFLESTSINEICLWHLNKLEQYKDMYYG